uniref:Uncharacterized protein n=1 Tax=Salix viminalis TaxID=40686 RepID=A0A6N2KHN4_SALVM
MAEQGQERRRRLVLVAAPFQGHINPLLQLRFSITIVHTQFNSPDPSNHPEFNFLFIQDGLSDHDVASLDLTAIVLVLNEKCQLPFQECLARLVKEQETRDDGIACVIYDELSYFSEAAARNLKLPSIIFRTSNANTFLARSVIIEMVASPWQVRGFGYVYEIMQHILILPSKFFPICLLLMRRHSYQTLVVPHEHPFADPVLPTSLLLVEVQGKYQSLSRSSAGASPLRQRDLPISVSDNENFFKLIGNVRDVKVFSNFTIQGFEGSSIAKLQQL